MRGVERRACVALLATLLLMAPAKAAGQETAAPARFDHDWSVQMLGGGEVELAALRGRVVVINFWATWCAPCVAELSSFQRLVEQARAAGLDATFLFVTAEPPEVVGPFVERYGWELPFATEVRRAPASLGELVLPTTFVVAPDGRIALKHRGATAWDTPEVMRLLKCLAGG